jgi:hypothetical protein
VRTFRGDVLREATHANVAAVAALDIGDADLQQCADSVIRMHAEWMWSRGQQAAITYRSASGLAMPWTRWSHGERVVPKGTNAIEWALGGKPVSDHAAFRKYLDTVFGWVNTVSLAREANPIPVSDLSPGDFVVMPGNPGHAVLILDLAEASDGRRAVLLGQGFMPAQSFHVLFPDAPASAAIGTAWFSIDPASEGLKTPFWSTFPWSSLRRLAR